MGIGIMAPEKDEQHWKDELERQKADIQWKADALLSIRENGLCTKRLETELRRYAQASETRARTMEEDMEARCDELKKGLFGVRKTVYGNGNGPGLTEKVRALASKWTTAIVIVTFLATTVIGGVIRHYEKKAIIAELRIK